jgi:hypothetical protein
MGSKEFSIEDGAFSDLEAERLVDLLGERVGELGVGRDFAAALSAGPVFCGAEKRYTDALAAMCRGYEPAFYVTHGTRYVAAVRVRAQADFEKTDK